MKKALNVILMIALAATAVWAVVYVCRFFSENAGESGSFFLLWQLYPVLFLCIMAGEVGLYCGLKYFLTERNKRPVRTVLIILLLAFSAVCIIFAVSALSEKGFLYEYVKAPVLIAVPICSVPAMIGLTAAETVVKRKTPHP